MARYRYLMLDGTFLQHRNGIFAVMDGSTHRVLYGAYGVKEGPPHLLPFCLYLQRQGVEPKSATIDGNPHIFSAVKEVWPHIVIQRCLIHVQRQGLSWCRQHPKRTDAQKLRRLLLGILKIHSKTQRRAFLHAFRQWNNTYGERLANTSNRGWVTSDLQRARSMLIKAMPYLFNYLMDKRIPRSTNALEGYFSRLKQRYRQHRGLHPRQRLDYFQWYFYLCPR